jgi:hypothetical protein
MICRHPATARFVARHLYNFFVADEVPVPSWRLTPPRDMEAIEAMEKAYYDSGYEIKAMLRVLFNSDFFKSEAVRYAKVKSPAEMVAGLMRLTGEHREMKPGLFEISQEPKYMGMDLMNPPTVEGWHTGHEWIDSGTLVERINFAAEYLGNSQLPGVKSMIDRLIARSAGPLSPEQFVDGCLDMVGPLDVADETHRELVAHAGRGGDAKHRTAAEKAEFSRRAGEMFQMIAATAEFQFA